MHTYSVKKIGDKDGTPRLWIEGVSAEKSGFTPGQSFNVVIDSERNMVTLTRDENGVRIVSSRKRGERVLPIIDLNSHKVLGIFEGMTAVRVVFRDGEIHILPLATEVRRQERLERVATKLATGVPLDVGSFSHGGGVLSHALHAGLQAAGIPVRLKFANEIREDLLDHARAANDTWGASTVAVAAPMQELAFDEYALRQLGTADICEAGLPCSAASSAGRAKTGYKCPEANPDVGHLVAAFIALIARFNPLVVLLENVPAYQNTASMHILRNQLHDMGYDVHETILHGAEWNAMEHRQRMSMVAVTKGMEFDFNSLVRPERVEQALETVLDDIADHDPRWSRMEGLKAKQERDKAAGKGFMMQVFDRKSTKIGTLTKGLAKNRSTDPKIQHETNPDLLRVPTAAEHARCKQIPLKLIEGLCSTTAHELLGQSIIWGPFRAVGELIGKSLQSLRDNTASAAPVASPYRLAAIG